MKNLFGARLFKKKKDSLAAHKGVAKRETPPQVPSDEEWDLDKYDEQWQGYAAYLAEQAQPCKQITETISILAIADTHNMSLGDDLLRFIDSRVDEADVVAFIGDISVGSLEKIMFIIDGRKSGIGVLGNHDEWDLYDDTDVHKIDSNIYVNGGFKITGMNGSIKYKNADFPCYTHNESIERANTMPSADIIISHDTPYIADRGGLTNHKGLMGVLKYIYDNRVPVNIHGHLHNDEELVLPNGCHSIGVYLAALVKISPEGIKTEFFSSYKT